MSSNNPANIAATLQLWDGAGFLVRVIGSRATALYEHATGQSAVTPQQFGVLLTLYQNQGMTLTELTEALSLDRSTLGEMVRRMDRRNLVCCRANSADKRSTMVDLAPAGKTMLLNLVDGAAALQDQLLAPIPREDRRLFLHYLKTVALAGEKSENRS